MKWDLLFFFNSVLLGVGLAMDAFSVSLANGLHEPKMARRKMCRIAGVFAIFQAVMPMLGWVCVHTIAQYFRSFQKMIPWIALALLSLIGGKMLLEGIKNKDNRPKEAQVGMAALLVQGVATSIDALSVGFTVAEYGPDKVFICVLIIAAVTFFVCIAGLILGKKFGTKLSNKASVLGGAILIVIGIEIFITGIF